MRWMLASILLMSSLATAGEGLPPVPLPEVRAAIEKKIREQYADDFGKQDAPSEKALAEKLLNVAQGMREETDAQYAHLNLAIDLFSKAGHVRGALAASKEILNRFKFEPAEKLEQTRQLLARLAPLAAEYSSARMLETSALSTMDAASAIEAFKLALEIGDLALQFARDGGPDSAKRVQARIDQVVKKKAAFDAMNAALETLKTKPKDPAANFAAGYYLFVYRNEIKPGLTHLLESDKPEWKEAARQDLKEPESMAESFLVGEGWATIAMKETGDAQKNMLKHANKWYGVTMQYARPEIMTRIAKKLGIDGPFAQRGEIYRALLVEKFEGTKETEKAVAKALAWLAANQEADGHWDSKKFGAEQVHDVAVTGLALLAFLGQGNTGLGASGDYSDVVSNAAAWLVTKQKPNGAIMLETDHNGAESTGWSHAIAGLALVEYTGMARATNVRDAAQKAVDYSLKVHQHDAGGWCQKEKDLGCMSITGWFVQQIHAAKLAGLTVDEPSVERAKKFLEQLKQHDLGVATFMFAPNNEQPRRAHRLTAIGTLGEYLFGAKTEAVIPSVQWFMDKGGVPAWGIKGATLDMDYWYFGAMSSFQTGGPLWTRWNTGMRDALIQNQVSIGQNDGTWDPLNGYSNQWGRAGQTALGALCLETYYRYPRINVVKP